MTVINKQLSKDAKYNKKRRPFFRVEASAADTDEDIAKMEQMKADLISKSQTAKRGVIEMYDFAKAQGFFDK